MYYLFQTCGLAPEAHDPDIVDEASRLIMTVWNKNYPTRLRWRTVMEYIEEKKCSHIAKTSSYIFTLII